MHAQDDRKHVCVVCFLFSFSCESFFLPFLLDSVLPLLLSPCHTSACNNPTRGIRALLQARRALCKLVCVDIRSSTVCSLFKSMSWTRDSCNLLWSFSSAQGFWCNGLALFMTAFVSPLPPPLCRALVLLPRLCPGDSVGESWSGTLGARAPARGCRVEGHTVPHVEKCASTTLQKGKLFSFKSLFLSIFLPGRASNFFPLPTLKG